MLGHQTRPSPFSRAVVLGAAPPWRCGVAAGTWQLCLLPGSGGGRASSWAFRSGVALAVAVLAWQAVTPPWAVPGASPAVSQLGAQGLHCPFSSWAPVWGRKHSCFLNVSLKNKMSLEVGREGQTPCVGGCCPAWSIAPFSFLRTNCGVKGLGLWAQLAPSCWLRVCWAEGKAALLPLVWD